MAPSRKDDPAIRRLLPAAAWLPRYERAWLRADVTAGIAVTALVVPKNLGYAGIAGVPLQNGLYAAAVGGIVYALFCTSRHISTGPSSSLAAVAGGAVIVAGLGGEEAAQLVAAIALATGLLFLLLALLKMGWIARFLSKAVITGFLAGAAIDVVIGELPKLTGTSAEGDSAWRELGSWLSSLADAHGTTVLVGVIALAVILGLRRVAPGGPGRARAGRRAGCWRPICSTWARTASRWSGTCRAGCPLRCCRTWTLVSEHYATIGIAAAALLLIGFSQTAGDARAFAARYRYRIDVDQESVAQGMANVGAGLFQGMPVSTSLSASSLNASSGARTQVSSLTTGALVLGTLIALAPLFSELPKAVLGAVIIDAVVFGMIDVAELRRLLPRHALRLLDRGGRDRRRALGRRARRGGHRRGPVARLAGLRRDPAGDAAARARGGHAGLPRRRRATRATRRSPGSSCCGSTAACSSPPRRRWRSASGELTEDGSRTPRALVLDLEGVNFVDSQGAAKVTEIHELTQADGVGLRLARVKPQVLARVQADGIVERIGPDHIHGNVHRAVEAQLAEAT